MFFMSFMVKKSFLCGLCLAGQGTRKRVASPFMRTQKAFTMEGMKDMKITGNANSKHLVFTFMFFMFFMCFMVRG